MKKEVSKSPIKVKPHRYAGQSIDEYIRKLIDNEVYPYLIFIAYLCGLTVYEWVRYFAALPPSPFIMSAVTAFFLIYGTYKFIKVRAKIKKLRQARDGELAVGQYLEGFRSSGGKVFHDVQGESFNIDHVLVSNKGVFALETKTFSKPVRGEAKITLEDSVFSINGKAKNDKIIIQALAQKKWLSQLLTKLVGVEVVARSVILFPGWFVSGKYKDESIWALNPKALATYVANLDDVLSDQEVKQISNRFSMYLREAY